MQKLIEKENLKILTENLNRERYIKENIEQLKQQQRLYSDRLKEIEFELRTEQITLQILEVQSYAAEKAIEDIKYNNLIVSNKIRKYDKVTVIANLPDQGEVEEAREKYIGKEGVVVGVDEQCSYPYNIEFYNEDGELEGCDWLWKREELEFTKGEW